MGKPDFNMPGFNKNSEFQSECSNSELQQKDDRHADHTTNGSCCCIEHFIITFFTFGINVKTVIQYHDSDQADQCNQFDLWWQDHPKCCLGGYPDCNTG